MVFKHIPFLLLLNLRFCPSNFSCRLRFNELVKPSFRIFLPYKDFEKRRMVYIDENLWKIS